MAVKRVPTTSKVISMLNDRGILKPVLDKDLATPPSTPAVGDRYIVASGGTDAWLDHDNNIAEWDGTQWVFYVPTEGNQVYVKDEDDQYFFDGSAWFKPYSEAIGDMTKAVYDTDDDGIVDKAEQLDDGAGNTAVPSEIRQAIDTDIPALQSGKADKVSGAVAGNLASLDDTGNLVDSGLKLDDLSTTTTNLWSASKIQAELDTKSDVGHTHDDRYYQKTEFISSSTGSADAGKPVVLDADGNIDATMINSADVDHNLIQNRGVHTHAEIDAHIDSTSNPHSVSLEQARSISNLLAGSIDMGGYNIVNLATPANSSDAVTKAYVDGLIQGIDWQESVLDKDLVVPPSAPSKGDRYLLYNEPDSGTDWAGHKGEIAEFDGSVWTFTLPSDGMAVWVEDEDILLVYNGSSWVRFGSTIDHGNLIGLGDDDHPQYLNVERGDLRYYTKTETDTLLSAKADKVSGATAGNLASLDDTGNLVDSGVSAIDVFRKSTDTLDNIADGVTYGKVLLSELSNGAVIQLNDGTNVVNAQQALKAYTSRALYDSTTDEIVFTDPDLL